MKYIGEKFMTIDVSLIPQNRVENLISKLSEIENNIGNIGTDITNNIVHKSGTETITGTKTFTSPIQRTASLGGSGNFLIKLTDSNGKGSVNQSSYYVNKTLYNRLNTINATSGNEAYIEVQNKDDGEYRAKIGGKGTNLSLTESQSSTTDTTIPTKGWVNNPTTSTNVVHRSGDESINGYKTFNHRIDFKCGVNYTTDSTDPFYVYQMSDANAVTNNLNATYSNISFITNDNIPIGIIGSCRYNQSNGGAIVNGFRLLTHDGTNWRTSFASNVNTVDGTMATYIQDKLLKAFVTETYSSGTSWYRVYSDGWIEQGGKTPSGGNDINVTVTLHKAFSNTNYYVNLTSNTTTNTFNAAQPNWVNSRTTTNFSAHIDAYGAGGSDWYACGY